MTIIVSVKINDGSPPVSAVVISRELRPRSSVCRGNDGWRKGGTPMSVAAFPGDRRRIAPLEIDEVQTMLVYWRPSGCGDHARTDIRR